MDGGSRKDQAKCNTISETVLRRISVGVVANYRLIDGEAWRCLDPVGIPDCAWYRMPLWIKIEVEPQIMSSRIDLAQAREGWRCHDRISTPMYEKM